MLSIPETVTPPAAVIAEEGFALGVERFQHVLAVLVRPQAEAAPQLANEDVEERPAPIPAGAALSLGKRSSSSQCLRSSIRSFRICFWRSASCRRADPSGLISEKRFDCQRIGDALGISSGPPSRAVLSAYCLIRRSPRDASRVGR